MKIWVTKVEVKINRRDFLQKLGSVSGMLAGVMFIPKLLVKVPPEPTPDPSPSPDPTPTPPINPNDINHMRVDGSPAKEIFNGLDPNYKDKFKYPNTIYHPDIDHSPNSIPHVMGYLNCSVPGCKCPAFMGNDQLCGNCGHNYTLHW